MRIMAVQPTHNARVHVRYADGSEEWISPTEARRRARMLLGAAAWAEAGVVRELIEAATRYLAATTRKSDDDPNCWAEEEHAEAHLREVLAKVRSEA